MIKIPPQELKSILSKQGLITDEQFDNVIKQANRMGQNVGDVLVANGVITYEYLYKIAASHLGVELADLKSRGIDGDVLNLVDEKLSKDRKIILFSKDSDGTINVAMSDPTDLPTIEFLEKKFNTRVRPYLATPSDMNKGFSMYGKEITEDFKKTIEETVRKSLEASASAKTEEEAATQVPIVDLVGNLLSYAASLGVSDIHWEALEDEVLIRFRVDGILREIVRISKQVYPAIIARIKLLSALKIDEHKKPQDGRFRFNTGDSLVDIRVSVIPTMHGEKIVLRILSSSQRPLSLSELGMMDDQIKIVERNIKKTYGLALVTGPTGSGKTTTLYSILNMLNRSEVNIVTIEDPIEYNIKYINQIQINPSAGITFASGLRSILRQDPNIIMVGEIRDSETANISVHAALTGHIVLSTLHTNDAPTSVPRLMDMDVEPYLVSAVLNFSIAQRLVRKICVDCIKSYEVPDETRESLKKQLQSEAEDDLKIEIPKTLFEGKGCKTCGGTGFKGRVGIFEIMEVTDEIRNIVNSDELTLSKLVNKAHETGMTTMLEDGIRKASLGVTTIEEVLRVIRD